MRTLVKTLTWRVVGSSSTFLISYIITGQLVVATGIAVMQMMANTILYYLHEVVWNSIKWRKE
jgi:uncharacterized membrane protein